MNLQTESEYKEVISACKDIFAKKTRDYGTAWRILRPSSITDQIYIKAMRLRSVQEKGVQLVNDKLEDEFVGIINYCVIALLQLKLDETAPMEMDVDRVMALYDEEVAETWSLLTRKNHDYGEAWREMRVSSITDIILMKIYRTRQIEDNNGQTLISEGVDANYRDMLNYAVFALIRSKETAL